jgi:hypothetical protein
MLPALAIQELGARVKAIGTAKSDLVTTQETLEASLSAAVAKSTVLTNISQTPRRYTNQDYSSYMCYEFTQSLSQRLCDSEGS